MILNEKQLNWGSLGQTWPRRREEGVNPWGGARGRPGRVTLNTAITALFLELI